MTQNPHILSHYVEAIKDVNIAIRRRDRYECGPWACKAVSYLQIILYCVGIFPVERHGVNLRRRTEIQG
jgi:hypothetical protein